MTASRYRTMLVSSLLALGQLCAAPQTFGQDTDRFRPSTVQDLAYGEVLFHFYQEDYFTALTQLLVAQARDEFSYHDGEAELLLGGLYLSYGLHRHAGEIFNRLLEQSVEPSLHDRAWFFLAKIWYQRGYLERSEQALARIGTNLPAELRQERHMLEARVHMEQGRFDDALAVLSRWEDPGEEWVGYAKYNIGVSLVRLGRIEDGARVLDEVGQLPATNANRTGLRDKANVALGYAWLQAERPDRAQPLLQRVRLQGPFSNKALLGVGWSDAERGDYRAALSPWLELRQRNIIDPAVQESLLAVPYAFSQLGADRQAADYYLDAIDAFNTEIGRMDAAISTVEDGVFVGELLNNRDTDASGWYWRLDELPDSTESHYLYEVVASNEFQEGLKNYRDLLYLRENLRRGSESLGVFDDILDTRQRAYEQRLPVIERALDRVDFDELAARRVAAESRLVAIERDENVWALGTEPEQAAWATLDAMDDKFDVLGSEPGAGMLREKQRFLRGILYWNLYRDYRARLWQAKKNLRSIEREFRSAQRSYHQVDFARAAWSEKFTTLTQRIAGLTPRVQTLGAQLDGLIVRQAAFLQGVATRELRAQRDRLSTYLVQARFALASVYDRSATMSSTTSPVIEPVAEGLR
ncbi:MAG: tetratricopeptide repeat protein [Gammaproteobacteria bacterium]|nr:tetratricopeptide repeat protein [Gammaproteobacteria bacterium]